MSSADWVFLSFDERQKLWAGHLRYFRQHHGRQDRPNVWEIRVDGDRVFTRHGLLNGQMQETNYVGKVKNGGKKNEISPAQDALAEARRDIRKKWDFEGYDEYVGDANVDKRNEDISVQHLLTNLPGSFCLYKPENEIEDQKKLFALANRGEAVFTLKRDGVAMWVVVDYYGNIQLYSRRSRPWSDTEEPTELPDGTLDYSTAKPWALRFPHLVEQVRLLNLPRGTMMAAELVAVNPVTGKDDLRISSGYTKGLTERSLFDQQANPPFFYWWDVPFYAGEDFVKHKSVGSRYEIIQEHAKDLTRTPHIQPIQVRCFPNVAAALEEAKRLGIEGWVVVDPNAIYGDKGWSLKGKPDRPTTCAKSKPTAEDDFIAYWDPDQKSMGEWGTGKHERDKEVMLPSGLVVKHGGVGSVALYQLNPKGELVYISKCSSGMEYEFQAQLTAKDFPFVCKVEYKGRTYISDGEKTNALRHPVFVEKRTDKTIAECVNEKL
jgi:ATP-dependent DNA ligase